MKIGLCTSFIPFVYGGARNIVDWLEIKLKELGHQVEKIYLPHIDAPDLLFQQKMAYRWVDLEAADQIICFRPPSHLIPHPNKILWFIHHIRIFYDLWDSPYRGMPDDLKHQGLRQAEHATDKAAFREAKKIFTNSKIVSERLEKYNQTASEVLYPPVLQPERFYSKEYNNEILTISRMEHHKRQHLLIQAMRFVKSPVCLRLCGVSLNQGYTEELVNLISEMGLEQRVKLENRWITEEEKIEILASCLAVAYLPLNEDSYGYPSIEASHASKAILTTTDSGGVLELVENGVNGYVVEPTPEAIAEAMDKLFYDRKQTKTLGKNAQAQLARLHVSWAHVLERLLA